MKRKLANIELIAPNKKPKIVESDLDVVCVDDMVTTPKPAPTASPRITNYFTPVICDLDDDNFELLATQADQLQHKQEEVKLAPSPAPTPTKKPKSPAKPRKKTIEISEGAKSAIQRDKNDKFLAMTDKERMLAQKKQRFEVQNKLKYAFLTNPTDFAGKQQGDEDFQANQLYIPVSSELEFTDYEKQYWEIKKHLNDCVVFYNKGIFYELYERDAGKPTQPDHNSPFQKLWIRSLALWSAVALPCNQ